MNNKQQEKGSNLGCWLNMLSFLALAAGHAWYLHGFLPVGGQITLALIGGVVLQTGLAMLLKALWKAPQSMGSLVIALVVVGFGTLTLFPGAPDSWLLKTPFGWPMLEARAERLDHAMRDNQLHLVRKIARVGLGDPAPRDSFGSPLIEDAKDPAILRALLQSGFDPDARDEDGRTLLMNTHDVELARVLLEFGAAANARDTQGGYTPLMLASRKEPDMVSLLTESGADVHAIDDHGRTVLDFYGSDQRLIDILQAHAGGRSLRSGTDKDYAELARRDWLVRKGVADARSLQPSSITVTPDPMAFDDLGEIEVRLTNETDIDRVMSVEAHLNTAALFVDASHDGKITNPYQPQVQQEIGWPHLALPAYSSGLLTLRVKARGWGAGDLSVDIRARNVLNYSEESGIFLNLYQPLTLRDVYEGGSLSGWLIVLLFPASFVFWFVAYHKLGSAHKVTRLSGRLAAGLFAFLAGSIAYQMVNDLIEPYTQYQEGTATILDRRFYLDSVTSSSSKGSRSTTTIVNVPIVAVRYQTPGGEIIAGGFSRQSSSAHSMRDLELGSEVTLWYDPDNPEQFTLSRGFGFLHLIGIGITSLVALVLGWVALHKRKPASGSLKEGLTR